jgi:hypothetical protein
MRFLCGNLKEKDHLEDASVDGWIILRWIFMKWDRESWTGLILIRIGTGGGEGCNVTSGSIKCGGISLLVESRLVSQE